MAKPTTVAAYIAKMPPVARRALEQLRTAIKAAAPDITERVSYRIPTFELDGQYLLYIAGFKEHVSVYPVTSGVRQIWQSDCTVSDREGHAPLPARRPGSNRPSAQASEGASARASRVRTRKPFGSPRGAQLLVYACVRSSRPTRACSCSAIEAGSPFRILARAGHPK